MDLAGAKQLNLVMSIVGETFSANAYVVVLETDNRAYSHQSAMHFNDYLEAEGLTPAIAYRERRHRDQDHLTVQDYQRTSAMGVATFAMPRGGNWLMSVVWTEPLMNANDADYETTFSSLTFAVPRDVQ